MCLSPMSPVVAELARAQAVHQGLQVQPDLQALRGHKARLVRKGRLDQQDSLVQQVRKGRQDLQAPLVRLVPLDHKAPLAPQDLLALQDQPAPKDRQDLLVRWEQPARQDRKDHRDLQDQSVQQGQLVHRDLAVLRVLKALLVRQAPKVHLVRLDLKDRVVQLVRRGLQGLLGLKDPLDRLDHRDQVGLPDQLDHLGLQVRPDPMFGRQCLRRWRRVRSQDICNSPITSHPQMRMPLQSK